MKNLAILQLPKVTRQLKRAPLTRMRATFYSKVKVVLEHFNGLYTMVMHKVYQVTKLR